MINTYIGQRVRDLRTEKGLTQEQLAQRAELANKTVVSSIETGRYAPSAATIQKLSHALGVEAGDLFPKATSRSPQDKAVERGLVATLVADMNRLFADFLPPEEVDPKRAEYAAHRIDRIIEEGMRLHGLWNPNMLDYEEVPGLEDFDIALGYWGQYALAVLKAAEQKETDRNRKAGLTMIIESLEKKVA